MMSSKMYPQGDKEKYWFGYRDKRFEDIKDCEKQYIVLGCRNTNLFVVKFPKEYIEKFLDRLNMSYDEEGNITHYHIVLFKNPNGKVTMLLSKPNLIEVDITEYIVGEV